MSSKEYPGTCTIARPELYTVSAMPKQPEVLKPGQQPEEVIKRFFDKGYLVIEDFFSEKELDPCLDALEEIVDDVANAIYDVGKLTDLHKDKDVFTRLPKIDEQFPGALVMTHKHSRLPPAFQNIWGNERLLNFLEQILGSHVCANPIWNIRPKAPSHPDGEIPWHQDSGYFDPASYGTLLPVVWVPLLDVSADNGCLQVIEGGHKRGVVSDHLNCYANTWHVMLDESKMETTLDISLEQDVKTLPVKKGGFIIFNNLVPHRSLPNKSDNVRWSLDLRFQRPGKPEGLYGAMPLVTLRDPAVPGLVPDWSPYASTRHNARPDDANAAPDADNKPPADDQAKSVKDLDTTITGPWMKQWPLVNSNKHTEAYGLKLEKNI